MNNTTDSLKSRHHHIIVYSTANFYRYGADAVKDIPKICTHGEFTKHVKLDPSSEVFGYAKAEAILVNFQDDITEDKQHALALQVKKIFNLTFNHFPGVEGVACGWGVEKDFPAPNENGQPRAVLMAVVGWQNAEVQRNHSEEDGHQEAISMITRLEGCTSFDTFTINCRHLTRS